MYIKDDIVYAGELTPMIEVIEAKPLEGAYAVGNVLNRREEII